MPDDITPDQLDPQVRAELRSLARPIADQVARRLVAAGKLVDDDPELALQHAVAARRLASRLGVVREAVGIAAYHAGQWQTALSEIRTYHRISGKQTHLAILADCERALGRPEKAIDIYRSASNRQADTAEAIELLIVAAGARRDMGQNEAALAMLQIRELTADAPWTARLRYAYADALFGLGRRDESRQWFARAVDADPDGETDAAERLLDLDGVELEEDGEDEDPELALAIAHDETGDQTGGAPPSDSAGAARTASIAPDEEGFDDEEFDDIEDDEDLEELDDEDDDDLDDDEDDDDLDDDEDDDDLDDEATGAEWEDYVPIETDARAEPLSEPIGDVTRPEDPVDKSVDKPA
ncbi:MAG TPA: tetratricopeptide repeat protein [Micromonosporaceae bacterium]|nr:tetratricopeptide repeat protein [Micromonosporaceae bacterium]